MRCAIDAKDEREKVGTLFNLFHEYLCTSVLLVYILLILFHNLFVTDRRLEKTA
jgi:hypothetical protein